MHCDLVAPVLCELQRLTVQVGLGGPKDPPVDRYVVLREDLSIGDVPELDAGRSRVHHNRHRARRPNVARGVHRPHYEVEIATPGEQDGPGVVADPDALVVRAPAVPPVLEPGGEVLGIIDPCGGGGAALVEVAVYHAIRGPRDKIQVTVAVRVSEERGRVPRDRNASEIVCLEAPGRGFLGACIL